MLLYSATSASGEIPGHPRASGFKLFDYIAGKDQTRNEDRLLGDGGSVELNTQNLCSRAAGGEERCLENVVSEC